MHYICTGVCEGVSETEGVCGAATCPKHGVPLTPCDCVDGKHNGKMDQDAEEKGDDASMLKEHIAYMKDNPRGYWFKRKLYGWGWVPATWQGWAVILLYLVLVFGFALTIDESSPPREVFFTFLLPGTLLTVTLIRICYLKGESPRWQWGVPKK